MVHGLGTVVRSRSQKVHGLVHDPCGVKGLRWSIVFGRCGGSEDQVVHGPGDLVRESGGP